MRSRRLLLLVLAALVIFIALVALIITMLSRPSVKTTQLFDTGSYYHMVTNNGVVTFIDNNSNIQRYNESLAKKEFIGSVAIEYKPKLAETGEYIATTKPSGQASTTISRLDVYNGNSLDGKTIVPYNYVKWGFGNQLLGLLPPNRASQGEGGPFESTIYSGQLNIINAAQPGQALTASDSNIRFETIAYANQDKLITTSTQTDGSITLTTLDARSWQPLGQQRLPSLVEYYQAKQFFLYRENNNSNLVVSMNAGQQFTTKLQTSPFLAYPLGGKRLAAIIKNNDQAKLVVYNYEANKTTKEMVLPDYVFKPNQLVTTDKNVYISTKGGIYMVENFLDGLK
ncbi:hypothetical protein HYX70_03940 [Candidatus Saccharibacteria bacterium]|nr:hypothetical protein [Candidatus Saccharibacteria bacterium]